jgi:putative PIN family toxin of toxin-antitoxin system
MIRAVADTNVIVSAALTQSGPSSLVLELANDGLIQLYISPALLAEYEEVLNRLRVGVLPLRAQAMLKQLKRLSRIVTPTKKVRVSTDPDDNMVLECAEAAKAHYLITGNTRHFPKRWKYTQMVTPRQFVDLFGSPTQKTGD